jgi:hypothetical protein
MTTAAVANPLTRAMSLPWHRTVIPISSKNTPNAAQSNHPRGRTIRPET